LSLDEKKSSVNETDRRRRGSNDDEGDVAPLARPKSRDAAARHVRRVCYRDNVTAAAAAAAAAADDDDDDDDNDDEAGGLDGDNPIFHCQRPATN
jgi:hypothetical protein